MEVILMDEPKKMRLHHSKNNCFSLYDHCQFLHYQYIVSMTTMPCGASKKPDSLFFRL